MRIRTRSVRIYVMIAVLAVLALFLGISYMRVPRTDRDWDERFMHPATVEYQQDGSVDLHSIRDWTYGIQTIADKTWRDVRVRPEDVTHVWFVLEPFSQFEAVGHTFLIFEFKDGTALSFSVEARSVKGQKYSAIAGLFNNYELSYTWGTERDFIERRLLFLMHPIRMYPLNVKPELAQGIFEQLLQDTTYVGTHPRFYNTLTANCTNVLAEIINEKYPHSVPYDLSWNFPGYSDTFLMKIGYIPLVASSTEATKAHADLTPYRERLAQAAAKPDSTAFEKEIRDILK